MSEKKHKPAIPAIAFAVLFVLALLLILIAWIYRDNLFQSLYDPAQPFQTYSPPPAPDYAMERSWLHRPDTKIDPIHIKGGDVFVVTPTVFLGRTGWNAALQNAKFEAESQNIILPNYVLPFKTAGRVFAPYYRQAALYAFLTNRDDARDAQILAYEDVHRAFEAFLANNPPERPIVLVGFGQGGLHVERLLTEFFKGDLRKKLAVAYIIDHPLPQDVLRTQIGLPACTSKEQTGCVVAFGAFEPKEKKRANMFVGKTLVWSLDKRFAPVEGRALVCINPLLWTDGRDYAPARLHLGGVAAEGLGEEANPAPMPSQTGAQCQDGILLLDKPKSKSLRRPSRFGGQFRTIPANLFYEDLRQDAARRVQQLLAKGELPKRAPLLDMEDIEVEDSPVTLPLKPYKRKKN